MTDRQNVLLAKVAFLVLLAGILVPWFLVILLLLFDIVSEITIWLAVGFGFLAAIVAIVLGRICRRRRQPLRAELQRDGNGPDWVIYVWHQLFEKTAIWDAIGWIIMAILAVIFFT